MYIRHILNQQFNQLLTSADQIVKFKISIVHQIVVSIPSLSRVNGYFISEGILLIYQYSEFNYDNLNCGKNLNKLENCFHNEIFDEIWLVINSFIYHLLVAIISFLFVRDFL